MNFEMETFRKSLAHGSFISFAVKKLKTPRCTHSKVILDHNVSKKWNYKFPVNLLESINKMLKVS